ncbi:MAG: response regulator [Verrucomicrobiota bacterium]
MDFIFNRLPAAVSDFTSMLNGSLVGVEAAIAILGAFALTWVYCRRAAQAQRFAREAEADAAQMHAQAESIQSDAEFAQANAEQAMHSAEQAQQFAAALIESATVIIIGVDVRERLRLFNQSAQKITGYTQEQLAKEDWLQTLFPGEDFAPAREGLMELMRQETGPYIETLLVAQSGEEKRISWQCRHVTYHDEPMVLLFGVDLTERELAEQERHGLERKLLDMQKLESLGVLAGGIAHDFNNLLTAILGNAQMAKIQLMRTGGAKQLQQYMVEIERTSMQAADLCKQMLAYSGQGKIEVRMLNLNQVIRDMSQLLRISVSKKVQLSFNLAHVLPMVHGDISQMRQVFMNLIINASEAISDREGFIWVSTGVVHGAKRLFRGTTVTGQPEERDYVFVEIADTGCGMSDETKARMFDPFFTTKFTGRGLGLAAVLGIIRSHGGTLELETRETEGTTFTLLFPCADAAAEPHREDEPQVMSHWSGEGLILVVDDEESVRTLTTRMLESFQFHVITACDGRDGVDKFHTHADAITAVLLDVTMPSMSGLEVLERIRTIRPHVPVIFMSGYMREGELRTLDTATDFLQKPFKLEDLQGKLRKMIDTQVGS